MVDMDIRPYQAGDAEGQLWMESAFCKVDLDKTPPHPAYTARINGQVVVCAGVRPFWPGVGEAWAFVSPDMSGYRRELLVYTRQYLDHIAECHKLWRIQAVVREDYPYGLRFAHHLGFRVEGKLRKYGTDGIDCFMYSRIYE